ncbi:methyl-accepting chemotaxis protein [Sphingomonas sp. LM7]|uniref:methyl-accepting chemotaxis protein n=1 Tax=Sphingomonas sp. LM7 TaxID=1938607 RepID=UPI000983BFB2|nr:methyl-accepting chemotaxis protein [Sphingomonas sp. LM7]AQR73587.1 methyl-accepting chemotaxis protein [Sphingomonas sp. LM7]
MADLLARIKIPVKIMGLLLMLGVITLSVAFYGSRALVGADAAYEQLVDKRLPITTKLARANRFVTQMLYASYRVMAYPGGSASGRVAAEQERQSYDNAVKVLEEIAQIDPEMKAEVDSYRSKVDSIHKRAQEAISHGMRDENDAARAILAEVDSTLELLSQELAKANNEDVASAQALSNELTASASSTSTTMLVVSVVAIAIAIGVGLLVSRLGITVPLVNLQTRMQKLAEGDNAADVPGTDRGDEVGAMARTVLVFREAAVQKEQADAAKKIADAEQQRVVATLESNLSKLAQGDLTSEINEAFSPTYESVKVNFNGAVAELRSLIGTVMESASTIRTGSGEIAQASEDLARRTEANAASLEETSAAVTQMDGRLKATAASAGRTVERADGAIATVSGGRAIADDAVQAMSRVADGAKGIDSVIEGLDKIAFQTRVLAMNAAVEAGRAGEAGRGFAVVADLVSALAMRSEEEAARARDQLTATQTDIVAAVEMVQKVDSALADISGDVGEVHSLLGQMASDNQAQSTAITEISIAIGTMDQSTQQNAAMVEQTSAAARNLTSEVAALSEQASRFSVGNGARVMTTRPTAPATPVKAPAKAHGYVSPVKALPVAAMASGGDDWASF